jgi:ATP-dependent exoDNAse (exonuclease V) beta subunit
VAVPLDDELLLEGYVDLVYREDDGLIVVDYKTDAFHGDVELDAKVDRYRLQGGAYTLALERATGLPVHRMIFCFLGDGGATERHLSDLPAAMADAEAAALALPPPD